MAIPDDPDCLAAVGTGRRLFGGHDGDAAETAIRIVLDNDLRWSALPNPANLEGLTTIGAGRCLVGRDEGCATATVKMKSSLDNLLDTYIRCHGLGAPTKLLIAKHTPWQGAVKANLRNLLSGEVLTARR